MTDNDTDHTPMTDEQYGAFLRKAALFDQVTVEMLAASKGSDQPLTFEDVEKVVNERLAADSK